MEFDEARFALGVDQAEGVHAKALHAAQAFRDRPVGHRPDHHVRRFRHQRDEVPERVVGRAAGRNFIVRLGFHRVDKVGELDRVLDEEHWHVVADQIEVALVSEELHRETAHVAHGVTGTAWPLHRGKTHEHRSLFPRVLQETGLGQRRMVLIGLEETMRAGTARVNDALRNAFVVKVRDFLTHDEVFQQRRPTRADLQSVLVIGDLHPLVGTQGLAGSVGAEFLQAIEFGVGVGAILGIGSGQLAFVGRRFLAAHQT